MKITELDWKPHYLGQGEHVKVYFPNGYGASCVRGGLFYTRDGTYEIAVLGPNGNLDHSTPITDDVLGFLTEDEANQVLSDIAGLPPKGKVNERKTTTAPVIPGPEANPTPLPQSDPSPGD